MNDGGLFLHFSGCTSFSLSLVVVVVSGGGGGYIPPRTLHCHSFSPRLLSSA
jgi:hypothetical protein